MSDQKTSEIRKIRVTLSFIAVLLWLFFFVAIGGVGLVGDGVSGSVDFFMNYRSKEASIALGVLGLLSLIMGGTGFFRGDMEKGIKIIFTYAALGFTFLLLAAVFSPEGGWAS